VKLKLLVFLVGFLIVSLLGPPELVSGSSEQTHYRNTNGLEVPSYLIDVPPEHFAGVSSPSNSLAEARKSAIGDAIRQILGALGVKYNHHYFDEVSGNVRNLQRVIDDKLSGKAQGIVLDVERSIVKSSWLTDASGNYVYFVLVYYPEEKIKEMRRLSKGAKIIASVFPDSGSDAIRLKVSEVNGVEVILTSADITVRKLNRFSKAISLFIWKVPESSEHSVSVAFNRVNLRASSSIVRLPIAGCSECGKKVGDYLLGAAYNRFAVLKGHDELGRPISVKVVF
jgi:hypothetical protein